jgi:hypothetical protein
MDSCSLKDLPLKGKELLEKKLPGIPIPLVVVLKVNFDILILGGTTRILSFKSSFRCFWDY